MRRAGTGVAGVLATLLTACAGIPPPAGSSRARPSANRSGQCRSGSGRTRPFPARTSIVQGYLDAMASYQRDYPTAREFLALPVAAA